MTQSNGSGIIETLLESEARGEPAEGRPGDDFLARVVETIRETIRQEERERSREPEETRRRTEQEDAQRRKTAAAQSPHRPPEERPRARFNRD